jgi:hypothetical protein
MVLYKGDQTFCVFLYHHFSHPISAPDPQPGDFPSWNVCQNLSLSYPNGSEINYTPVPLLVGCESTGLSSSMHHLARPPTLAIIS